MKGRAISYSADELAWIEANRGLVIGDLHHAFCERFGRDDVSAVNLNALRKRKGWKTGRTGRFEAGQTPINKGRKCPPGVGGNHPNARKTQFRKGERRGVAVDLYKTIGTERLSKDGYVERKIHDGLPLQSRWRAVHLIRWEELHGPVPEGMCLKSLDGNKANTDPANWELIPRAMLPRLNGRYGRDYDHASAEVKPTIMAIAKLEHRARTVGGGD
ncbi:HNH endonuclease [Hephaestia caeni]|uniref:HNH endonuclease n=1 Tax=Hephaestia caeni TaxID=645617 RepID=A0A397P3B9_9SPHN|nr:HNH endonuclease [Hephaestia caeni]RIA44076.1 HNH endonuclease [Hephaestia caeni]